METWTLSENEKLSKAESFICTGGGDPGKAVNSK